MSNPELQKVSRLKEYREALGNVYEERYEELLRIVCSKVGDIHHASDITSSAFQKTWESMYQGKFTPRGALKGAIFGVAFIAACRLAINYHRDSQRRRAALEKNSHDSDLYGNASDIFANPEDIVIEKEREEKIQAVIKDSVNEEGSLILDLKIQGLTNRDIGLRVGRTEGAIKAYLNRTMSKLRQTTKDIEKELL